MFILLPIVPILGTVSTILTAATAATVASTAVNLAFHYNKLCKQSKKKEQSDD